MVSAVTPEVGMVVVQTTQVLGGVIVNVFLIFRIRKHTFEQNSPLYANLIPCSRML